MRYLIGLMLLISGCSVDVSESKPAPSSGVAAAAGGGFLGSGGGSSGTVCQGESEMRQVEVDGKMFWMEVPIDCVDKWFDPSYPSPELGGDELENSAAIQENLQEM